MDICSSKKGSPTDFTPENLGSAHWRNLHNEEKYVFYTLNANDSWNPVEYINDKWYSLTYDTNDTNFYVKETDALEVFDPRHPKYKTTRKAREPEASGSTEGLAETLQTAPVFEDIAEDTQPAQPRRDYMPTTVPLRPSRFANLNNPLFNPSSATNNPWMPPAPHPSQQNYNVPAGINPDMLQYLIRAMGQFGQSNPEQMRTQQDPPPTRNTGVEGSLKGKTPKPFTGKRKEAMNFLSDFNNYWICNENNVSMKIPYYRVAICLGFFEGDDICEWKDNQTHQLQDKVRKGTAHGNEDLWDNFKREFLNSFHDTAAKECTLEEFSTLEQKGEEIDNYIIKFNNLSSRLQYDRNSPLLVEKFCGGLTK